MGAGRTDAAHDEDEQEGVGDGDDGREEGREDLLEGLEPPEEPDHLRRRAAARPSGALGRSPFARVWRQSVRHWHWQHPGT